jgi:hypothetical protein
MVFPLIGWVDDDKAEVVNWIFRTGMNSNWYKDGNIKIPVDSDLIIGFKSLSFSMF